MTSDSCSYESILLNEITESSPQDEVVTTENIAYHTTAILQVANPAFNSSCPRNRNLHYDVVNLVESTITQHEEPEMDTYDYVDVSIREP